MTQVSAMLMLMMLVQLVVTCNDGYREWRHEDSVTRDTHNTTHSPPKQHNTLIEGKGLK